MSILNNMKCVIGMGCKHCWHLFRGPIWMVTPEGPLSKNVVIVMKPV